MNELGQIFETNRVIVYSVYGQVFFVMGLVALLQARKHSRLALARSLWLLGTFGILHGISEWAYVFVPIQAEYLPTDIVTLLWSAHTVIEAVSFAFLFQFGVALLWPAEGRAGRVRLLPAAVLALWALLFVYIATSVQLGLNRQEAGSLFAVADVIGRYTLALPGATLVGVGLLREAKTVAAMALPVIARYLKWAAASFLVYAVFAGLVVPPADFLLAGVLNKDLFRQLGVPVPIFRSICGLAITYFIARGLKVFEVEMDRLIEQMEHERTIAVERERIGRELHDGTIQSIYAAGLALEDVAYTMGKEPDLAGQKVREVMALLNRAIGDIRKYILDLHSLSDDRQFEKQLRVLVHEYADRSGVKARVDVRMHQHKPLPSEQASDLLQVAREALANIAKHAKASQVAVMLSYGSEAITLEIGDNGCGFDLEQIAGPGARRKGNGLNNMTRRMEMVGGTLQIETAPGRGTRLIAGIPVARDVA